MSNLNNVPVLKKDANLTICQDSFQDRAFRGDYTGTNLIYRGYARPGVVDADDKWQIANLEYDASDNLLSIKWPIGATGPSSEYEFVWSDRATYTFV